MSKNTIKWFAACAVVFVAISAFGTELTHRWSFNGDYADAVGGADAVKCGTYVSLYGGKVHMGYGECSHGTGYVNLGKNILDTTAATIEVRGLVLWRDGALWTVSPRNCENADLTEKKTNIIHSHLKRRKDESRDKKRSTQWKAVCGKSARTV